jgi:type IV pilus assembly protein PilV
MNRLNQRQRGVGLVEVLIAVLVLSIGLLGLAGLQLRTIRNNESALERGVAVTETHAIADALRADRNNAQSGLFNITLAAAAPTGTTFRDTVVRNWRANLISALGAGATGRIFCNGADCTITIQWDDSRAGGATATTQQLTTQIQI